MIIKRWPFRVQPATIIDHEARLEYSRSDAAALGQGQSKEPINRDNLFLYVKGARCA